MEQKVQEFATDKQLMRTLLNNFGHVIVFFFYAEWNKPSVQLLQSFKESIEIFGQYDNVRYFSICAEKCPETLKKFNVEKTPTIILTQTDKKIHRRFDNVELSEVFEEMEVVSAQVKDQFEKDRVIWHPKVQQILDSCPVIVFIKGTPANPKCGFSTTLLEMLKKYGVEYTYYDIIEDEYMRYWLRHYKNWPTYPQLYINGKFIGGLDLIKELDQNGKFEGLFPESSKKKEPSERYAQMVKEQDVVVVMDGFPFESKVMEAAVVKAKECYGENVHLLNVALDQELKEFILKEVRQEVPFIVDKGKIVQQ